MSLSSNKKFFCTCHSRYYADHSLFEGTIYPHPYQREHCTISLDINNFGKRGSMNSETLTQPCFFKAIKSSWKCKQCRPSNTQNDLIICIKHYLNREKLSYRIPQTSSTVCHLNSSKGKKNLQEGDLTIRCDSRANSFSFSEGATYYRYQRQSSNLPRSADKLYGFPLKFFERQEIFPNRAIRSISTQFTSGFIFF